MMPIRQRRELWAMDLLHWSLKICPKGFRRDFLEYMKQYAEMHQRCDGNSGT
jgi:hypothetical protein